MSGMNDSEVLLRWLYALMTQSCRWFTHKHIMQSLDSFLGPCLILCESFLYIKTLLFYSKHNEQEQFSMQSTLVYVARNFCCPPVTVVTYLYRLLDFVVSVAAHAPIGFWF